MESIDGECVSEFLSTSEVIDFEESVVQWGEAYPLIAKPIGEMAVSVAVELQSKRHPCRHSQVAETELGINEVEVIVEALGFLGAQKCLTGCLVVPGGV